MNRRYQDFQKILLLSKTMFECAMNGAWDDLTKIESSRQTLINEFFAIPVIDTDIEWLEPAIQELLNIDKETVAKSRQEMEQICGSMQQMKSAQQGAQAYQKNM